MHSTRKPLDSGPPQLISCRSPERSPGVSFRPISPLKQPVSPVSILAPLPSTPTINVAKSLEGGIPRTYSEIDLDGEPMNLADFRAKYNQPGFYIMKDGMLLKMIKSHTVSKVLSIMRVILKTKF